MDAISPFLPPQWSQAIWDISGAFIFDREILAFHDFCQNILGLTQPIAYVHGSPALIWNSGRVSREIVPHSAHAASLQAYEQRRINVLLTASNTMLRAEHIQDKTANEYCERLNQPKAHHGVILCSDALNAHLQQHYPHLQRISSILKITHERGKERLDVYKRYLDEFDLVMLHPDDVIDPDFLATLPEPGRFIALINEYCIRQCPIRHLHYKDLSEMSLNYLGHDTSSFTKLQSGNGCDSIYQLLLHPTQGTLALSHEEIATLYSLGLRHFKVQGRGMGNASPYLVDLLRLMLRIDSHDEARMYGIRQLFWESYQPTV